MFPVHHGSSSILLVNFFWKSYRFHSAAFANNRFDKSKVWQVDDGGGRADRDQLTEVVGRPSALAPLSTHPLFPNSSSLQKKLIAFNCCGAACWALLFDSTNVCHKRHLWWCLVLIPCKMKFFVGFFYPLHLPVSRTVSFAYLIGSFP